jgi:methionine-rich copper-binding protein CopC
MHFHFAIASAALAIAALMTPAAAVAHARVVASTPAEGATVARPSTLSLTFSEAMLPPTVATSIVMTAMPGMADHPPMTIRNFQSAWSDENRTLTLALKQPLVAGTYDLRWQAAGADGHRMTGKVGFIVQ